MFRVRKITDEQGRVLIQDPPVARFLFQGTLASWLWLVARLWLGYSWLSSGLFNPVTGNWGKIGNPAWMDGSGTAILGYWQRAVALNPETGTGPITYDWYRGFLQFLIETNSAGWFSYLIVFGEITVGLGLVLGAFTGLAAAGGLLMNLSFMLAGTTSANPVMAVLAILLILAWKNAGYIGLDRYLLPMLGTPWKQPLEEATQASPRAVRAIA
jgi:thiosulfate dehydrogenase (quinone) large subunit